MKKLIILIALLAISGIAYADPCVECHEMNTPGAVADWKLSKHFENDISCSVCYGEGHSSGADVDKVTLPTAQTCAECHDTQVEQFTKGKHALGWASFKAMPTTHNLPMVLVEGQKGCGGCHKIGLKTEEEIKDLKAKGSTYGHASCDACHTRHIFSVKEAQQPQACQTCHMGFDHPQWEMYSSS